VKPVDPALIRRLGSVRWLLTVSVVLSGLGGAAIVGQAAAIAHILSAAIGAGPSVVEVPTTDLLVLVAAIAVRAGAGWAGERVAGSAAGAAIGQLRGDLLVAVAEGGSRWRASSSMAELQPLLTRGLDGLHAYLGRFLPALVTAVLVPPGIVLVLLSLDPLSALIVALTLPLIPLFMALIGSYTESATRDSLATISALAGRFADVVAGLPALVVFGRVRSQARAVGAAAEAHRRAATRTLRVAFLSSMALELIATLSVALIAVAGGLRLSGGGMGIATALMVLLIAPEAYLPLRAVGAGFHAAADGAAAVSRALEIIGENPPAGGGRTDTAAVPGLWWQDVRVDFASGRSLTLGSQQIPAGRITVLRGPSGAGKTTVLKLLAGLDSPDSGRVLVGGADEYPLDLAEVDRAHWHAHLGWVGQRVALRPGTLRDNLTAGHRVPADLIDAVVSACCLCEAAAELPDGLDTVVGPGARDLSTGQRRRVSLARALLTGGSVLLLDEPTEGLDDTTERDVLKGIRPLLAGRTVVITTHRPAVAALADRCIELAVEPARPATSAGADADVDESGLPVPARSARQFQGGRA